MKPQFLTTENRKELVALSRRDDDSLLAQLGDEDAEDRMTVRIAEEAEGSDRRGREEELVTLDQIHSDGLLARELLGK